MTEPRTPDQLTRLPDGSRKPYETPTLTKLGTITELTQGYSDPLPDAMVLGSQ
ncbi:MAG: lasso RiPP family leader peptide-containing protein [Gemmatimonadales bacterium]